jgi:hypothetical protein
MCVRATASVGARVPRRGWRPRGRGARGGTPRSASERTRETPPYEECARESCIHSCKEDVQCELRLCVCARAVSVRVRPHCSLGARRHRAESIDRPRSPLDRARRTTDPCAPRTLETIHAHFRRFFADHSRTHSAPTGIHRPTPTITQVGSIRHEEHNRACRILSHTHHHPCVYFMTDFAIFYDRSISMHGWMVASRMVGAVAPPLRTAGCTTRNREERETQIQQRRIKRRGDTTQGSLTDIDCSCAQWRTSTGNGKAQYVGTRASSSLLIEIDVCITLCVEKHYYPLCYLLVTASPACRLPTL